MRAGTPGCPDVSFLLKSHAHVHTYMYHTDTQVHAHIFACTHARTHTHTYTHTRTQIEDWLATNLPPFGKLGIDPFVHTVDMVRKLNKKMKVSLQEDEGELAIRLR